MGIERITDEEAIFNAAVAIEAADERSAYLRDACGGDAALLGRIEALLSVHASEHSFLEQAAYSLQLTLDVPGVVEGPGTAIGRYAEALGEVETCVKMQPEKTVHRVHQFCILTALGRYEQAQAMYEEIVARGERDQMHCRLTTARHVFDCLAAGQPWHPDGSVPAGAAFEAMRQAEDEYRRLAAIGRRTVAEGFHPAWSPDGTELAYSRGVLGASAIEIRNLQTGKTRLLVVPGKDPAWSPDGRWIAYVRDRQVMSLEDLTTRREGEHPPMEQEEIWIIRADGSGSPRYLARGGWPHWNRDSSRVYYHSRTQSKLCCVSADPNNLQQRELFDCMTMFPAVSPDEKLVAIMPDDVSLQILDLSTRAVVATWTGPRDRQQLFFDWSPDGRYLSIGCYWGGGLWIYDVEKKAASKVVDGSFSWCSWSDPQRTRMAAEKVYAQWHHEIWIIDRDPALRP